MIDPKSMSGAGIHELSITGDNRLGSLLHWGQTLRDLATKLGARVRPTSGGFAAQFLRHPRFYPEPRRIVPSATNRVARNAMPGNHYEYKLPLGQVEPHVICLDQESAHHNAARSLDFPDANTLLARGRYHGLDQIKTLANNGLNPKSPHNAKAVLDKSELSKPGLFYLALAVPPRIEDRFTFLPPYARRERDTMAFIFSNELPFLRELGIQIRYAVAAWTADEPEPAGIGVSHYASFALSYLADRKQTERPEIKPILLSLYGVLGARARENRFSYAQGEPDEPRKAISTGGRWNLLVVPKEPVKCPARLANTIHRGMIEAETRLRSIRKANLLSKQGHNVLGIHADAIFIGGDQQLALPEKPWRIKYEARGHSFPFAGAVVNSVERKLPGITPEQAEQRADRDRVAITN